MSEICSEKYYSKKISKRSSKQELKNGALHVRCKSKLSGNKQVREKLISNKDCS